MGEFVSEAIRPVGDFEVSAMARGEPGLPGGFEWRGEVYEIAERLGQWKQSSPEGGRSGAEVYLRRHYYELLMSDGSVWVVYFLRQAARGGSKKSRWFLSERSEGEGQ